MSSHMGHPSRASRPVGRRDKAAVAATVASSQFDTNDNAVSPRFAPRLPRAHGLATNIGRAVSISAPMAMIVRMIVTLVRNSRAVMKCLPFAILEAASSATTDDYLIFLSGFAERSAMTHNRICGSLFWRRTRDDAEI